MAEIARRRRRLIVHGETQPLIYVIDPVETLGMIKRRGAKQQGVGDREHRRIRPDSKRERQDHHRRANPGELHRLRAA